MTTRREFLGQGAAVIAALTAPAMGRAATPRFDQFTARPANVQLAPPAYSKTEIWGYDGEMPGPELRRAMLDFG